MVDQVNAAADLLKNLFGVEIEVKKHGYRLTLSIAFTTFDTKNVDVQ